MANVDEKLAFLLDDYPGDNADAALDEVIGDVNLQYSARRYRLIGEAMRNELPQAVDTGFHSAVMARVRAEAETMRQHQPVDSLPQDPVASIWNWISLKPVAGLALAATVAVVTVALWQPPGQDSEGLGDELVVISPNETGKNAGQSVPVVVPVPVSTSVQPLGMRWKIERNMPGMQRKLNAYLVNHTEHSNSVQGLIPQARVAGFDARQ